ncbi:MAG TPA: ester cyclase [Thermoleophilaceae bacterium]|nr:ester cyclase [Thermoleophilaceae bacterium]
MNVIEHNRNLVRRLVEIVNERALDRIAEVASGQVAEAAAGWVGPFADSFPDFRMEVVDVIAEEDRVVGWFRCSGTHEREWRGRAPSHRRFEGIDELYVFRVTDGKLDQALVAVEDNLARMRQLGLIDAGEP